MARSHNIWIVRYAYPMPDLLLGAFTVKHELASWLGQQEDARKFLISCARDGNLRYLGTDWEVPIYPRVPLSEFTKLPEFKRAYDTTHSTPWEDDVLTTPFRIQDR
jgi:hypothetical protein